MAPTRTPCIQQREDPALCRRVLVDHALDSDGYRSQIAQPFCAVHLDALKAHSDGSLDLYYQNESRAPTGGQLVPAPKGPLILTMRLYAPGGALTASGPASGHPETKRSGLGQMSPGVGELVPRPPKRIAYLDTSWPPPGMSAIKGHAPLRITPYEIDPLDRTVRASRRCGFPVGAKAALLERHLKA